MEAMFCLVYFVLAYLAMKKIWWSKHTYIIVDPFRTFTWRVIVSACVGIIVIPIAGIMLLLEFSKSSKKQ